MRGIATAAASPGVRRSVRCGATADSSTANPLAAHSAYMSGYQATYAGWLRSHGPRFSTLPASAKSGSSGRNATTNATR